MFVLTMCWRTEQNFLLPAINLIVPVSICRQLASLWVSKFVITFNSFDTKLEEKFERYLRFDREFNWIEVLVFNFPAKLFLLRLLHQQKFNFVFRKSNRLCFTFTVKQISFLSYRNLIIWVFFIVIGCLWIISQQVKVLESLES